MKGHKSPTHDESCQKGNWVEEAIDYLKSINAPFGKNFDGRGMVISNIDTGTDYRHKAMRIDDDAKASMRFKKEDLKGTDKIIGWVIKSLMRSIIIMVAKSL